MVVKGTVVTYPLMKERGNGGVGEERKFRGCGLMRLTMTADQLEGRASKGGDGQATGDWTMAAD